MLNTTKNPAADGMAAAKEDNRIAKMVETYRAAVVAGKSHPLAVMEALHGHRNPRRTNAFMNHPEIKAAGAAYMATVQI